MATSLCFSPRFVVPKANWQLPDFWNYRSVRVSHERRCIYPTAEKWVEAAGYLFAWCLRKHRLELYALGLFFNHHHKDVGHPLIDGPQARARYSDLFQSFHWWYWRLLVTAGGWQHGPAYTPRERTYQGPSLDAEQIWHDLTYDTANPVAAGFFKRSKDYPGLCLQPENVTEPRVFKRNSLIAQLDPERKIFEDDELELKLSIPRPFKHMSPEEYQAEFRRRLDAYEAEVAHDRVHRVRKAVRICNSVRLGKRLGKKDMVEMTRGKQPPTRKKEHYRVGATDSEMRQAFFELRRQFWADTRTALEAVRAGEANVVFPAGTYGWSKLLNAELGPPPDRPWAQACWHPD
jgi:hypothetical protein